MLKILDRYLIREILLPFFLALLVLTFILEIPPILQQGEKLIAKGVAWGIVIRILLTLLPQALGVTIPIALLLGILIGLGRLSADREVVAFQACGVSLMRMLRPIALLAVLAFAGTLYDLIEALPDANQTFRELTFGVVAARAAGDVKARSFFEDFPNRVLYVRDIPPGGGWRDVFLADATHVDQTTVYLAKEGQLLVDRQKRTVHLLLKSGVRHTTQTAKPEEYERVAFDSIVLNLEPETVFPRVNLIKGDPEMTIAELRASIAEANKLGDPGYRQHFMIQQKFSLPTACLVLALIGLALGASNRKDGKLASFVLGFGVIFVYYVLLYLGRALALGARIDPSWGPWIPNVVLGIAAVVLMVVRIKAADRAIRISLPFWRGTRTQGQEAHEPQQLREVPAARDHRMSGARDRVVSAPARQRVVLVIRVPHLDLPRPRLLDLYVSGQYLRIFGLGVLALLGVFYIATFMDVAEKLFRGTATTGMLLRYFYFETPQYVYYVIPMAVLVATLVTIGLMTKNSELVVVKACGISLYRTAAPLLLFAAVASAILFQLQEHVIAYSNREADQLLRAIKGFPPQTFGMVNRRWIVGGTGDIYHYDLFDPHANRFTRFTKYQIDDRAWRLESLVYASDVNLIRTLEDDGRSTVAWQAQNGWERSLTMVGQGVQTRYGVRYAPFTERTLALEPPGYFKSEEPSAELMTYSQLQRYIVELQSSGFYAVPFLVQLNRKVAFPFVTVIMTLLAVPFAVTTGRRGALYGIGAGIVLAIVYWVALSVFAAVGAGGLLSPALAAWAPNILCAAAAAYMILTVRT